MILKRRFSTIIKYIEGELKPNICKDCKYFQPDNFYFLTQNRYEFGKCKKSMDLNLVSGKINYNYASITREYKCKGEWFKTCK